jgi:hypothetical protein
MVEFVFALIGYLCLVQVLEARTAIGSAIKYVKYLHIDLSGALNLKHPSVTGYLAAFAVFKCWIVAMGLHTAAGCLELPLPGMSLDLTTLEPQVWWYRVNNPEADLHSPCAPAFAVTADVADVATEQDCNRDESRVSMHTALLTVLRTPHSEHLCQRERTSTAASVQVQDPL